MFLYCVGKFLELSEGKCVGEMEDFPEHKKHRAKESGPKALKRDFAKKKKQGVDTSSNREKNPKVPSGNGGNTNYHSHRHILLNLLLPPRDRQEGLWIWSARGSIFQLSQISLHLHHQH